MAEHQHGSMDITVQQHTYNGFVSFIKWGVGIVIVALVLLALFNA